MIVRNGLAISPRLNAARADARTLPGAVWRNARPAGLFASFVFLQFTVLGLANHAGEGFLTTGQRELVYYALQIFVILGFLLHAGFARFYVNHKAGPGIRKGIAYTVCGLLFACAAVLLLTGTDSLFYIIVSMAAALCVGIIGGAAHLQMSLEALAGARIAKQMGFGSAVAVVLQYLLQLGWGVSPLLLLFLLGSLLLLAHLLSGKESGLAAEEVRKTESTPPRLILFAVLISAVFILFSCFYNETIHHLMIQSGYGAYNVYSWPRLMLVPGYLLFALLGDRTEGRYVPLASLCIMLIALLTVALAGSPETHWLNMCLFYFSIAAFTSYYLLTFWRLAPGTKYPALWAPFGRMLDSGMVLLTGAIHLSALPAAAVLGADLAGGVLVILLMAVNGSLDLRETPVRELAANEDAADLPSATASADPLPAEVSEAPVPFIVLSEEETLDRMRAQYDLTPRETEVLRELVLTEDTQSAISERLSIQVRTLQNHVTRIYRKTGVGTRAGLTDLVHETRLRSGTEN